MVRNKKSPQKHNEALDNLRANGEFIPVIPKRKQRLKSPRERIIGYQLLPYKDHQNDYYLGDLRLGVTNNVVPEKVFTWKVSFKSDNAESSTIILNSKDECVVIESHDDISLFKDLVQSKVFTFDVYSQQEYVYVRISLLEVPLPKFTSKIGKSLQVAFQTFYNIDIQDLLSEKTNSISSSSDDELQSLYQKLMDRKKLVELSPLESDQLNFLRPTLRPYQEQAVRWMVNREIKVTICGQVNPLYEKITLKSGCDIYLDKWSGWVEKDPPLVQSCWKGGILADEMGLGKTVEVLALILTNYCDTEVKLKPSDKQLIIKYETQKHKLPKNEDIETVEKKKKLTNTPPEVPEKGKSGTFKALQAIYNRTLSEYSTVLKRVRSTEKQVQCICGSRQDTGCVDCVDCGKTQHRSCLGWTASLGPYHCPQCWEKIDPVDTKATLIVAPNALKKQWCREMRTHLKAGLKVLNYEGYSTTPIYPTALQQYDIVITTYNVLQAEMRLTETEQSLHLRHQRKYWPGGSALVRVKWWRLCLDEAQTVETPSCIVSLMAGKIPAKHRWAVTGTPMAKGLSDIFGLINYLKMEPYSDLNTWKQILYDPYVQGNTEPMLSFLSEILWRTSKSSVLDQINIPPQTQELHLLEFSAVEKFFYNREHEICAGDFLRTASTFESDLPLEKINKRDLKKLMGPLLSLRQACSDPSAVRGKGRYLSMKKDVSSMKDLLDALILKNKNDCEESLRLMISSINGRAGIYLLMQDLEQAVNEYRKVLHLAAKFSSAEKEGKLVVDKLLLIHAMHNLGEVLSTYTPQERTLRDDTLFEDCAKLEKQYIEKFMKESTAAIETLTSLTTTVDNHQNEMVLKYGQWYSDGFDWVTINNLENDLITRVQAVAERASLEIDPISETSRSLLRKVHYYHTTLEQSRLKLYEAIKNLCLEDPESKNVLIVEGLVEKAMDCHLRPQKSKGKKKAQKCPVCLANDHLKNYEMELYTMQKRTANFEDMALEGSWKVRIEEILLKGLLGLMKVKNARPELIKDGETHVMTIETMKKEFKEIRKVWTLLDRQICAQDELSICKVRLQLKTDDDGIPLKRTVNRTLKNLSYEQKSSHDFINLIMPAELSHQELKLRLDEISQNSRLESLLGTRNYLETLRRQQYEGCNPDPCPVCHSPLTNTWVILTCAHTLCMDCFQTLLTRALTEIQCCVCRSNQKLQDLAYIHADQTTDSKDAVNDDTFVAGNYSRKVEAVVRLLLNLRKSDSNVKVILFSTWSQVLKLLKKALEQNDIKVELAEANGYFSSTIESFKDPLKKVAALLLPVRLGAKGLNLIEATHVVLLEPLLNPADELQAIGRVHRFGQTRQTVVHKFLIRNTVEESLHNATSSNASGWEKGRVTVGDLKGLFKTVSEKAGTAGDSGETTHCQAD